MGYKITEIAKKRYIRKSVRSSQRQKIIVVIAHSNWAAIFSRGYSLSFQNLKRQSIINLLFYPGYGINDDRTAQ